MAQNWTVAEAAVEIKRGNKEAIADFGKRMPLATYTLTGAIIADATGAVVNLLQVLPAYNTMTKLERILKEGVSESDTSENEEEEVTESAGKEEKAEAKPEAKAETKSADGMVDFDKMNAKAIYDFGKAKGIKFASTKRQDMIDQLIKEGLAGEAEPVKAEKAEKKEEAATGYYEGKTAKELYKLCKDKGIEVEPKQKAEVYLKALEAADMEDEEETEDYSKMSAKDLYKLCKERGIEVEQKKPAKYYIEKLEAEEEGVVGEEEDDEWGID